MKQVLFAAMALALASPALAGTEVCFDVATNIRDDNGRTVMQRVCVSDDHPAPPLRMIEDTRR